MRVILDLSDREWTILGEVRAAARLQSDADVFMVAMYRLAREFDIKGLHPSDYAVGSKQRRVFHGEHRPDQAVASTPPGCVASTAAPPAPSLRLASYQVEVRDGEEQLWTVSGQVVAPFLDLYQQAHLAVHEQLTTRQVGCCPYRVERLELVIAPAGVLQ